MFIRPPGDQPLRSVTPRRWSGVLLMSLLIAVPPEVQINTRKDRKRCSLLDDNSTATPDYDSAHANYTVNYMRQLQNHDYRHMTTIRLVTSPFYCTSQASTMTSASPADTKVTGAASAKREAVQAMGDLWGIR